MTFKVGPKGQVVIPKAERDRLGIAPGSEIVFEAIDEGVVLRRRESISDLRGMFKRSGMAERLLEDRAREPR